MNNYWVYESPMFPNEKCLTLIKIGVSNELDIAYIFLITAIWQIEDEL